MRGNESFCELSSVGLRGGHTLPNHAHCQLRYTPILRRNIQRAFIIYVFVPFVKYMPDIALTFLENVVK